MAVRTARPEVLNRVHHVVRAYLRQQDQVMNVNETGCHLAICGNEIKATHRARCAVVTNAGLPSAGVALVAIDQYLLDRTLHVHSILDLLAECGEIPLDAVSAQLLVGDCG